jgi:ubiquinol-cytochrome c reductase cytochrome b subunit
MSKAYGGEKIPLDDGHGHDEHAAIGHGGDEEHAAVGSGDEDRSLTH